MYEAGESKGITGDAHGVNKSYTERLEEERKLLEGKKVDLNLLNDDQFWHYLRLNGIHFDGDPREPEDLDRDPDNVAYWITLRMTFLEEHA